MGVSSAEAEKEREADARDEQIQAQAGAKDRSLKETWNALWRKDVRVRTILGVFLNGMSNASGVDGVLYVRPGHAEIWFLMLH